MLDELNMYLPVAVLCFNVLSMKELKLTLWSIIHFYFVDPNVWQCLNKSRYCSTWIAFRSFHKVSFFLLLYYLSCLKHFNLQLNQNYSTFCCTLLAATFWSVNACHSFVLFSELEQSRHHTMLLLIFVLLLNKIPCWKVQNIYRWLNAADYYVLVLRILYHTSKITDS